MGDAASPASEDDIIQLRPGTLIRLLLPGRYCCVCRPLSEKILQPERFFRQVDELPEEVLCDGAGCRGLVGTWGDWGVLRTSSMTAQQARQAIADTCGVGGCQICSHGTRFPASGSAPLGRPADGGNDSPYHLRFSPHLMRKRKFASKISLLIPRRGLRLLTRPTTTLCLEQRKVRRTRSSSMMMMFPLSEMLQKTLILMTLRSGASTFKCLPFREQFVMRFMDL